MGRKTSTLPGAGMQTLVHVVYSCITYKQLTYHTYFVVCKHDDCTEDRWCVNVSMSVESRHVQGEIK